MSFSPVVRLPSLALLILPASIAGAAAAEGEPPAPYSDLIPIASEQRNGGETERDGGDDAPVALETIVVTGEKLGRTLDETTTSVTALSGATLDDYGDDSVTDLFNRMANVSVGLEGEISIRGVSWGGAEGYGSGQPVISTYVDGIAVDEIAQNGNVLDLFDVDQIEILRGAQSTSQGRNALAGAIVINTREPTPYWDLLARTRAGELGEQQLAVAGGGPLGRSLAFRLLADYRHTDGFVSNTTLDDPDWNARRDLLLRGKLAWTPAALPEMSALLTVGGARRDGGGAKINREADAEGDDARRKARDDVPGDAHMESLPVSLRLRYALTSDLELTATTGYIDTESSEYADYDGSAADHGDYTYDLHGRTLSQELRLNVADRHGFTGVVGIYGGRFGRDALYQAYDFPVRLSEVLPVPVVGDLVEAQVDYRTLSDERAENIAAFAEFDYAVNERLTLIAGLRYDREHSDIVSDYVVSAADTTVATPDELAQLDFLLSRIPAIPSLLLYQTLGVVPGTGGEKRAGATYDAVLPKAGGRYALTPQLTAFLTYSDAYRAGGADVDTQTGNIYQYDPEYTHTVETGLRALSFDGRLRTAINVYHTDWVDQQVLVYDSETGGFYTQNAADSTLYGAEFENTLRLGGASSAYLNVGYSRTRFNDYVVSAEDYSGNEFVEAPRWTGSVGGVWRGASGWFSSASFSFTDTAFSTAENDSRETADARRLLDARLGYEARGWAVYAYGRNLLDEDYAVYRYAYAGGYGIEPGRSVGYGEPRVLGVQLEARLR